MDVKLKTSEMLLRKLDFGCGDVQLQAVAEIRLFAKYDDRNRACLGRAGAIEPLIQLLHESPEARVRENALLALLNMSINAENKVRMVCKEGGLDVVIQLANESESRDVRANAAALLCSLIVDDEARKFASANEKLWSTLVALLRDGSANCKAEALKALFVVAGDNLIREKLLEEDLQTVSLLISMSTVGKVKLTEDCLAVLALLASSGAGAAAITRVPTSISVLVYLLNSGTTARVMENAASVLVNVCQNNKEARDYMPLNVLIPALNSLYWGGSERGRGKAEALLGLLGHDLPSSRQRDPNSNFNYNLKPTMSMPFLAANPHDPSPSPPHQSNPIAHLSSSSSSSGNKYISLAKNLFTQKPRKKNHSTIS